MFSWKGDKYFLGKGVLIGVKETAEVLVVRRLVPLLGRVSGVYTGVTCTGIRVLRKKAEKAYFRSYSIGLVRFRYFDT